jgi:hypothetical protein
MDYVEELKKSKEPSTKVERRIEELRKSKEILNNANLGTVCLV